VSGQLHAPTALPPGKSSRYPLDRRLGVPQSRSGRHGEVKILDSTGTRTATPRCPANSQPLYRLSYPACHSKAPINSVMTWWNTRGITFWSSYVIFCYFYSRMGCGIVEDSQICRQWHLLFDPHRLSVATVSRGLIHSNICVLQVAEEHYQVIEFKWRECEPITRILSPYQCEPAGIATQYSS
jgi:hypothetical protein